MADAQDTTLVPTAPARDLAQLPLDQWTDAELASAPISRVGELSLARLSALGDDVKAQLGTAVLAQLGLEVSGNSLVPVGSVNKDVLAKISDAAVGAEQVVVNAAVNTEKAVVGAAKTAINKVEEVGAGVIGKIGNVLGKNSDIAGQIRPESSGLGRGAA